MASSDGATVHPVDQVPPAGRLILLGLQHILVMYAGAIAVPLIAGRALPLTPERPSRPWRAMATRCISASHCWSFWVMFGMVAATGIRALAKVDFANDRNSLIIVAVAVALGMIPLASDRFFQALPARLAPLLGSGIFLATIAAVALNLPFNRRSPDA